MSELYALWLVTSVASGILAAAVAKTVGRNPSRWFLIGCAANVLVLAVLATLKNRRAKQASKPI